MNDFLKDFLHRLWQHTEMLLGFAALLLFAGVVTAFIFLMVEIVIPLLYDNLGIPGLIGLGLFLYPVCVSVWSAYLDYRFRTNKKWPRWRNDMR